MTVDRQRETEVETPTHRSIAARDGDGSQPRSVRSPHPVPPSSLIWKYYGDRRRVLLGPRAGTTENMYPQLGQAVSDHSVIFTNLMDRVRRSDLQIMDAIYGTNPAETGIKIRNFHKPLKGIVNDDSKYHGTAYKGLDPETFYWAHATFVDMTLAHVERFNRPLSLTEKERLFQESRSWFSLYGMDDSVQPTSYPEFQEYWDEVVRNELVGHTKVAQYTVGYITKGITRAFPAPPKLPAWLWHKVIAPPINTFYAFIGAGGLDDEMREKLGIAWSPGQARRYTIFCAALRAFGPLWERFAPLDWRYEKQAADAFRREGINPRTI